MECMKCHSPRIIRFIDGFGFWRVFCKSCQESFLMDKENSLRYIKKLSEFVYYDVHLLKNGAAH